MKKAILVATVFLSALTFSCSSDDERTSPTFRFLEFEKDVLLPALNEREITFLAIDFDENIGKWELILSDGQQNNPVTLSKVETTIHGWQSTESRLQRIYVKTPALGEGDYLLQIKNKTSGQIHSEKFLIRSDVFNQISQEYPNTSYTLISSYSEGETKPITDYLYFQNTSSTITADITKNGIQKITLDNRDFSKSFILGHEISTNNEIVFTIPETIPVGSYFLSVHYDNGLSSYFEKDIIVLERQIPVVESINKETFSEGETLILKGKDFRYDIKPGILPADGLSNPRTTSFLVFKDNQKEYTLSFGAYAEYDERYEDINTEATELIYKIPSKSNAFFYIENGKNYFEGEVFVRNGPYDSNPMPIRIEY
jgi:hypothetical protein